MKFHEKIFTDIEIIAMREALLEYKHFLKNAKPKSEAAIKHKKVVSALLDDFKNTKLS